MSWQLRTHLALVNLYQTEASHSPELDLSKFAITALVDIQRLFDQAKRLGAEHGVAIDTIKHAAILIGLARKPHRAFADRHSRRTEEAGFGAL